MNDKYTAERNIQILIYLLKSHGIRRVIASPGATDVSLVASLQHDSFFEMYSCVDERSAAYMACGMAAETGEPVVITCTGATSSRNYMPGLTEAYYRQLPVLAVTCCRSNVNVGHYVDQVTDRSNIPNDIALVSVYAQSIHSLEDEWDVMIKINKAILGLKNLGGGPCHINLATVYNKNFSIKELAPARVINRYTQNDVLPSIPKGKVGIFIGAHVRMSDELTILIVRFCEIHNAAVFCDHTSNYKGKYRVLFPLIMDQCSVKIGETGLDLLIHIGNVSNCVLKAKEMWRVNEDGVLRDTFRRTTKIFQMPEQVFFMNYTQEQKSIETTTYQEWIGKYNSLLNSLPELPFSNMWIARKLASRLPEGSVFHLGIRNSIRSWNYFEVPKSVLGYCNTGGFGIDGGVSSLIGASMIHPEKLYFGFFGDLLFFYDMNSIGNRDIRPNVRILIVNNGLGQEFKNYGCYSSMFGDETDLYIAARGHFGNQSRTLLKCYAENLGFKYITASNKEEFEQVYMDFLAPQIADKPIFFEVFTDTKDESAAFELVTTISSAAKIIRQSKKVLSSSAGSEISKLAKKFIS